MKVLSLPAKEDGSPRSANERLEAIVSAYGGFLRSAIARFCPSHLGIQITDIEQEATIRLWRALESEREITDLASYVYRIGATTTIDAVRRVKARREEQLRLAGDEAGVAPTELPPSEVPSPESIAGSREIGEKIRAALNGLTENRRRAVKLHLQGFSSRAVGELLGWSEAKARNLIYRGLEDLRQELRAWGIERETH